MKRCTLQIAVEYDETKTDAESIATALDKVLETGLAAAGSELKADYGAVEVNEFLVAVDGAGLL